MDPGGVGALIGIGSMIFCFGVYTCSNYFENRKAAKKQQQPTQTLQSPLLVRRRSWRMSDLIGKPKQIILV
jgi:hypothetical protein